MNSAIKSLFGCCFSHRGVRGVPPKKPADTELREEFGEPRLFKAADNKSPTTSPISNDRIEPLSTEKKHHSLSPLKIDDKPEGPDDEIIKVDHSPKSENNRYE